MTLDLINKAKIIFSGHDSFPCRHMWLKKGYDFVLKGYSFNDDNAVVILGVGKNMVSSIRFWLKAFNIIDTDDKLTEFGEYLFDDKNGKDPYLEDIASLWLLHYQLVKNNYSSIYSIIFNEFRKEKLHFNKEVFVNYIKRIAENNPDINLNENTISKDFNVFTNLYKSDSTNKEIEDSFSGILSEIELLSSLGVGKDEQYYIENIERYELPFEIVLFSILDNQNYGNSISLNSLEFNINSPGTIFALNRIGLINKITEMVTENKNIVFTDHAGIKELQIKSKPSSFSILDYYYDK
jgi:hypothetical protein